MSQPVATEEQTAQENVTTFRPAETTPTKPYRVCLFGCFSTLEILTHWLPSAPHTAALALFLPDWPSRSVFEHILGLLSLTRQTKFTKSTHTSSAFPRPTHDGTALA